MRVVKGNNAQWPEAAEHGEDGEAQMVPGWQHNEVVLTLAVAGAVALEGRHSWSTVGVVFVRHMHLMNRYHFSLNSDQGL